MRVVGTGDALLDAQLPGGGWPVGALVEIVQAQGVHSEWRLLLPALVAVGQGAVLLVGPPQLPFGPALAAQGLAPARLVWVRAQSEPERLWAAEQALRCAGVDAVLAWLGPVRSEALRRLHIAAAEYQKLLFVMRPEVAQHTASPAVLRLGLAYMQEGAQGDALEVRLLKRRGPPLEQALSLRARAAPLARLLLAARTQGMSRPGGTQKGGADVLDCLTA